MKSTEIGLTPKKFFWLSLFDLKRIIQSQIFHVVISLSSYLCLIFLNAVRLVQRIIGGRLGGEGVKE